MIHDSFIMQVTTVLTAICAGLNMPNLQAVQAECLPKNAAGETANAGRDVTITILFTFAPGIVMPILGGTLFQIAPSKQLAYEVLLLWWLLTAVIALYFLVALFQALGSGRGGRTAGTAAASALVAWPRRRRRPPIGARLCDRLLFGRMVTNQARRRSAIVFDTSVEDFR
jgi:hypothetical protein